MTAEDILEKHLFNCATELVQNNHHLEALDLFKKPSANPRFFPIYALLFDKIINTRQDYDYKVVASLRNLFLQVIKDFTPQHDFETIQKLLRCLFVTHFEALYKALGLVDKQQVDLTLIRLHIKVSMLRYIWPLLPDKAFYLAAKECMLFDEYKEMGYVFFHCLMNILKSSGDEDKNYEDDGLFELTDVPSDFILPKHKFLTENEQQDVEDWLNIFVSKVGEKKLRLDTRKVYEASTFDTEGNMFPICVLSGYPVLGEGHNLGGIFATKHAWDAFNKIAPHTCEEITDVKVFLAKWAAL